MKKIPHRRIRLSSQARASLVLQGRYMGYMRRLKPSQKARVRRIRGMKGGEGGDCEGEGNDTILEPVFAWAKNRPLRSPIGS